MVTGSPVTGDGFLMPDTTGFEATGSMASGHLVTGVLVQCEQVTTGFRATGQADAGLQEAGVVQPERATTGAVVDTSKAYGLPVVGLSESVLGSSELTRKSDPSSG